MINLSNSKEDTLEMMEEKLSYVIDKLEKRYKDLPAHSLSEIIKDNKDLPIPYINVWTKKTRGSTSAQYLKDLGIIMPDVTEEKTEEQKKEERRNDFKQLSDYLISRYCDHPVSSLREVVEQNPNYSFVYFNSWTREFCGMTAGEYCRKKGIIVPNEEKTKEEKLSHAIQCLKKGLAGKKLRSLSEINSYGLDISTVALNNWVKKVKGKTLSEYLYELDMLEKNSLLSNENTKNSAKKEIVFVEGKSNEDDQRLYQHIYSISRVYDEPSGISVSKIVSLLGDNIDENRVRGILDTAPWSIKISNDIYSFSRNPISFPSVRTISRRIDSFDYVSDSDFFDYLFYKCGMAKTTCHTYISSIRGAEEYAKSHGFEPCDIFDSTSAEVMQVIQDLLSDNDFLEVNAQQHYRYSSALSKLTDYVLNPNATQRDTSIREFKEQKSVPTDFDKSKFEETLMHRYRNGMKFDSIDFDIFRDTYNMLFNEEVPFNDQELKERLMQCGVFYKDRIFPAEGILDEETRNKLFIYVDNIFASGKKVLYFKAIIEDLSDDFSHCFNLTDEKMLRAYIMFVSEKGKYYFSSEYMSKEINVSIDNAAEIEELLLLAGKPMTIDGICASLSHIPKSQVTRIIATDDRFLRNSKGEYFHTDIFEISEIEMNQISAIINDYINVDEYAIWTDVWNEINNTMPAFVENNLYLSWLGVRNALAKRFEGEFNFEGAVISLPKHQYAMRDIYQLFAKHHQQFTADNIYDLSKKLDTVIYFDALAEVSVRVSHDLFVSKESIFFDVNAIDKAIESFISKDYIRVREIDSFLTFPNVGYEWNEYLLESFVYSYSKKFVLLSNGLSLNNVAGAIVKKNGSIQEFVDVCAADLATAPITLNKKDALNYLAEVNMITRRSYRDLDVAIRKANQIRIRKG